jgi:hypothetical protein
MTAPSFRMRNACEPYESFVRAALHPHKGRMEATSRARGRTAKACMVVALLLLACTARDDESGVVSASHARTDSITNTGSSTGPSTGANAGAPTRADASANFEAPPKVAASLVLEPDVLHIGEVVNAEIRVLTPPEHRVLPVVPVKVQGLALLGVRAHAPERGTGRWLHRTSIRLRAELMGEAEWPASFVEIEDAEGTVERLEIPARSFEVASLSERFPGREEPFGLEGPLPEHVASGPSFALGVVLGLLLAAVIALCAWLVQRARRSGSGSEEPLEPPALDLFAWTDRELRDAVEVLEADPRRAASAGAKLLRVYMARRFGSDTEAATTQELERRTPALAERSLWPDFVRILHSFDDERFRPARETPRPELGRVLAALEDTRRLVEASATGSSARTSRSRT